MYCVIVGDIVNSRSLAPEIRERVTGAANNIFDRINTDHIDSLMMLFGMVRGDAFEGVLLTQYLAPKIVQDIIKAIYRVEKTTVRISVVLGQLTVAGRDRNETDGPAFHTALDELEKMKAKKNSGWLQVSFTVEPPVQPLVDSQLALLAALTEGWTDRQRKIVWATEAHDDYQKIVAQVMEIPPSVVNKQLKAAHYDVYRGAWKALTEYLINMDELAIDELKKAPEKSYVPYLNVAMHKMKQCNYIEALSLFLKSLERAKKDLNEDDPQLAQIYSNLARAYTESEQYEEAGEAITESLRLQGSLPKTRLQYLETVAVKAWMLYRLGEFEKAEKWYEIASKLAEDTLSADHLFFGKINNDLAVLYKESGKYEKALDLLSKALTISKENTGTQPVSYAAVLMNMANCYRRLKNYKQAVICAEEALQVYEKNLPPKHEYIQGAKNLLLDLESSLKSSEEGKTA